MKIKKTIRALLWLCLSSVLLAGCIAAETSDVTESTAPDTDVSKEQLSLQISQNISAASTENEPSGEQSQSPAFDWDFNKGWPVYSGEYVDTCEDICWPYGDGEWFNTAGAFACVGEELLFHVMISDTALSWCGGSCDELGELMQALGIPYEKDGTNLHLNLSYRDAVKLTEYMTEAGMSDKDRYTLLYTFCNCGNFGTQTETASPAVPEDWAALAWDMASGNG